MTAAILEAEQQGRAELSLKILREARRRIESRDSTFICLAINDARWSLDCYGDEATRRQAERLMGRMESVLEGYSTLDSWVAAKRGLEPGSWPARVEMRDIRLAYLDKWIAAIKETYNVN